MRRAGRVEGEAGREKAQKKPNPARDSAWSGEVVGLVSVQAAVRADAPSVNGGRWGGADSALDYQRLIDGLLS